MSGTFPEGTKLRRMWYMDLGRNQFTGTLPTLENYVRLRHLHLDFNEFVGTVPATVVNAGQGRLKSLTLNNNQLTGFLPGPIEQDFLGTSLKESYRIHTCLTKQTYPNIHFSSSSIHCSKQ